ncbi:MAG: hypothetical protein CVU57_02905 [Deltaproteobacteria bacterium HGW-Deltaproteobacteria-15]|jgi:hypothetical protein|nr:MAG: hypothetical protein CVU57_02905 [Deltaproteobacteria bacterium HGW-Deltaproteobacteria-15]
MADPSIRKKPFAIAVQPDRRRGEQEMKKRVLFEGADHTNMLPCFRRLVIETGIRKQENLIFAGCEGPCYSMATFFSFAIRDLNLSLYFAADAKLEQIRRLEYVKGVGMVATEREKPVKSKVLVLMSGLVHVPFENTLSLVREVLGEEGIIIGETVVPGLFEEKEWHTRIPFRYIFEFSMRNPTVYKMEE